MEKYQVESNGTMKDHKIQSMKNLKARWLVFLLLVLLSACIEPQELKIVNWNNHAIKWSVINGGATTSFLWKIHFQKNGSKRERLIFQSISFPYITDISVNGDYLFIHSGDSKFMHIHLDKLDDFIDDPIKYRKGVLEYTNNSYHEPDFIKKERKDAIK